MFLRDAFDTTAGALSVLPEVHQLGDLGHGEAQVAAALDKAQRVHIGRTVEPVAAVCTRHFA